MDAEVGHARRRHHAEGHPDGTAIPHGGLRSGGVHEVAGDVGLGVQEDPCRPAARGVAARRQVRGRLEGVQQALDGRHAPTAALMLFYFQIHVIAQLIYGTAYS